MIYLLLFFTFAVYAQNEHVSLPSEIVQSVIQIYQELPNSSWSETFKNTLECLTHDSTIIPYQLACELTQECIDKVDQHKTDVIIDAIKKYKSMLEDDPWNLLIPHDEIGAYRRKKLKKFCNVIMNNLKVRNKSTTKNLEVCQNAIIDGNLTVVGNTTFLGTTNIVTFTGIADIDNFVQNLGASTNNAIARFDGTTGQFIQNSAVLVNDFVSGPPAYVELIADDGATANITLVLSPKGSGALTMDIPDGSISGGAGRGSGAVDFQTSRVGAGEVAAGANSALIGGISNRTASIASIVAGGEVNVASAQDAAVLGGNSNTASGTTAVVVGGLSNTASGNFSFAAGSNAQATNQGSFVWADSQPFAFASNGVDTWSVRSVGGARFVSAIDGAGAPTAGVTLAPGGNAWAAISDRNLKDNIREVKPVDVLEKLCSIPISTWNLKSQDSSIRHMGPMAQDFYPAFGLGEDPLKITTQDADGVALAAIQGLYQVLLEKEAQLNARLEALEQNKN